MAYVELVIKIPEEDYIKISNSNPSYADDFNLYYAIKNGTPLPKGHGKIIDATFALEAKITKDNIEVSERTKGWNEACQAIYENATTIIEADKAESEGKE